ncbi:MAG TPA: hypothetical protein PLP48_06525 [Acholeplasmataceae bacterium]|nr:hypothetical protein [Acholeplasmataceae bacterium]
MNLEEFLDHHMDKDVHDVILVDDLGKDITSEIPGAKYNTLEIGEVQYQKYAVVKICIL